MKRKISTILGFSIITGCIAIFLSCFFLVSLKVDKKVDKDKVVDIETTQEIRYVDFVSGKMQEVSEKTQYQIIKAEKENCEDFLDTNCWNTFVNGKYGYKIKYPKTWEAKFHQFSEESIVGLNIYLTPNYGQDPYYVNDPYYSPLSISVRDGEGKTFDDWHKSKYSQPVDIARLEEAERITYNNTEFVIFNGKFTPHYFAVNNDQFISFSLVDHDSSNKENVKKMMETMVFSFEFIL